MKRTLLAFWDEGPPRSRNKAGHGAGVPLFGAAGGGVRRGNMDTAKLNSRSRPSPDVLC